ncbi:MAG: EI24 domain-containing protein [Planctomycetes bacterium]|nr:EI24 domain-containing protein [Planctomycetota bacterium]
MQPPLPSAPQGFAAGASAVLRGARFLKSHPSLVPYLLLPWMLTLLAAAGLGVLAYEHFGAIRDLIWKAPESAWLKPLYAVFAALLGVLGIAACGLGGFLFGQILAAPVYTRMAMRVRRLYDAAAPRPASGWRADLLNPVIGQTLKTAIFLGVHALLLPLHLIPVAGAIAQFALSSLFTIFWISLNYFDFPLDTDPAPLGIRQRIAYVLANRRMTLAFGAVVFVILLIPLVNLFLLPVGVIGATLVHADLRRCADPEEGEVPTPAPRSDPPTSR